MSQEGQGVDIRKDEDAERKDGERLGTGEGEEGRKAMKIKAPPQVSNKHVEEHNAAHCPFQSLCRYCVEGRTHDMADSRIDDKDDGGMKIPRISMDYFHASQEHEQANGNPMFANVNRDSGEKYARAMGSKDLADTEAVH